MFPSSNDHASVQPHRLQYRALEVRKERVLSSYLVQYYANPSIFPPEIVLSSFGWAYLSCPQTAVLHGDVQNLDLNQ